MITNNINQLFKDLATFKSLPDVVIATKYATPTTIQELIQCDHPIIFGVNRLQHGSELQRYTKNKIIPWHFIGHAQRNKIKKIIQNFQLIHSIDSIRLIDEINIQSKKINKKTNILLQINTANDERKLGFSKDTIFDAIEYTSKLENTQIIGLMTMAPHTNDHQLIEKTFKETRKIYDKIISNGVQLKHLSMGMSNDYKIAINEGSTMIRVGSIIFK